jgi:hypothetical protein
VYVVHVELCVSALWNSNVVEEDDNRADAPILVMEAHLTMVNRFKRRQYRGMSPMIRSEI